MIIKKIEWISEEIKEAEIIVSDGTFELLCFSHPCSFVEGQIIDKYISTLDANNIVRVDEHTLVVEKAEEYFAYNITGKVIDIKNGIVQVGSMYLIVDGYMPGDIVNGEFISFRCMRLDLH